jgi:hypothetical protein
VLLLLLDLRADHDEVQRHQHDHQRQVLGQTRQASGGSGGISGVGVGDEHDSIPSA